VGNRIPLPLAPHGGCDTRARWGSRRLCVGGSVHQDVDGPAVSDVSADTVFDSERVVYMGFYGP